MNETHFLSCFSIITKAHGCQMILYDDMVGFDGDQKEKCATAMEIILGLQPEPDIPETLMGWPV